MGVGVVCWLSAWLSVPVIEFLVWWINLGDLAGLIRIRTKDPSRKSEGASVRATKVFRFARAELEVEVRVLTFSNYDRRFLRSVTFS